jgi:hypothetical protein
MHSATSAVSNHALMATMVHNKFEVAKAPESSRRQQAWL